MTYEISRDNQEAGPALRRYARVGGMLYLIIILGGLVGEAFIRNGLIVPGDAAATAESIRASMPLWRVGVALELFMLVCTTVLALILYVLLRPVSRDLALLAVFFNLVSIAFEATNEMNLLATLSLLSNAPSLVGLGPEQLHALAYLPTRAYVYGFGVSLIFFGCFCVVIGYLIRRSGYIPKAIGLLMQVAGACYLVNSFALILSPTIAGRLYPVVLIPPLLGELSLALWLLLRGARGNRIPPSPRAPHA